MKLKDAEMGRTVRVKTKYLRWYGMEGIIVDIVTGPGITFPIHVKFGAQDWFVCVFEGRNLEYVEKED